MNYSFEPAATPDAPPLTPARKPATFVLIHGAFHGGWCYQRVAELLRAQGHRVYAPSLTGLADRSHLLSPSIGLKTHVDDVVNLFKWEDLHEVVLCGHSYGGMVITGAVEALEGRVKSLVYLDAMVPDAGKSVLDYSTPASKVRFDALALSAGGGYVAPISAAAFHVNEKDRAWVDAQCTRQPYQTLRDSLPAVTVRDRIAHKFYVLAEKYASEMMAGFAAPRRSLPDWTVIDLPHGHDLMLDAPGEVADILLRAAA